MIKISEEPPETKRHGMAMTVPDPSNPLRREFITEQYLKEQSQDQKDYYTGNRKAMEDDNDVIFELLKVEEILSITIPLRRANQSGGNNSQLRERLTAIARENPLTPEQLAMTTEGIELNAKIQTLLEKTNTTRNDWVKDGPLYTQYHRSASLKKLHKIQATIIRVVTERTLELDILHHWTRGHKQAKKAITANNTRWPQLDRLVNSYNREVRQINSGDQGSEIGGLRVEVHEVNAHDIGQKGIECDEVRDVDRMLWRSDSAMHHFVRKGIKVHFLLDRVIKERERLQLHFKRICPWVLRQCRVLIEILDPAANVTISRDSIKVLLLHHDKMAANLLEIKQQDLCSTETRVLLEGM